MINYLIRAQPKALQEGLELIDGVVSEEPGEGPGGLGPSSRVPGDLGEERVDEVGGVLANVLGVGVA